MDRRHVKAEDRAIVDTAVIETFAQRLALFRPAEDQRERSPFAGAERSLVFADDASKDKRMARVFETIWGSKCLTLSRPGACAALSLICRAPASLFMRISP